MEKSFVNLAIQNLQTNVANSLLGAKIPKIGSGATYHHFLKLSVFNLLNQI